LHHLGDYHYPSLLHPLAVKPESVHIGKGVIVYPFTAIDPDVTLDNFVFLNKCTSIGHDASIGEYTVLSLHCTVGGHTIIENRCFIGMGAHVLQNIRVGARGVVGAGAVVIRNSPSGNVMVGIPAKPIRFNTNQH